MQLERRPSQLNDSSVSEAAEEAEVNDILDSLKNRSKQFVMSGETMWRLAFDITVQIIRILVLILLLVYVELQHP